MATDLNAITAILNEAPVAGVGDQLTRSVGRPKVDKAKVEKGKVSNSAPAPDPAGRVSPTVPVEGVGADPLEAIEGLLNGDVVEDAVDDEPAADTLKALATKLGVEPSDLYKVKVPLGGDVEMTLGEIKDIAKRATDIDVAQLTLDEAIEHHRVAALRDREDLMAVANLIPREFLTPAMVAKAREQAEGYQREQGDLLATLVPEWRDDEVYKADRAVILKHVKAAGFSESDLDGLHDAKLLAYFRRQSRREERMEAILARMQSAGSLGRGFKNNAGARKHAATAARVAAASGHVPQQTKVSAIESLLRDTMK